jgi:hypothetical protein
MRPHENHKRQHLEASGPSSSGTLPYWKHLAAVFFLPCRCNSVSNSRLQFLWTKAMSKGLGRLERFILQRVSAKPVCLRTAELAGEAMTTRQAMARALHSFVRKFPEYAINGGSGRHALVLYEPADKTSRQWAMSWRCSDRKNVLMEHPAQSFRTSEN